MEQAYKLKGTIEEKNSGTREDSASELGDESGAHLEETHDVVARVLGVQLLRICNHDIIQGYNN